MWEGEGDMSCSAYIGFTKKSEHNDFEVRFSDQRITSP